MTLFVPTQLTANGRHGSKTFLVDVLSHVELVHSKLLDMYSKNQPLVESPVKDNVSKLKNAKTQNALVCN